MESSKRRSKLLSLVSIVNIEHLKKKQRLLNSFAADIQLNNRVKIQ